MAMTARVIGIRKSNGRLAGALDAGSTTWGLVMTAPPYLWGAEGIWQLRSAASCVRSHQCRRWVWTPAVVEWILRARLAWRVHGASPRRRVVATRYQTRGQYPWPPD